MFLRNSVYFRSNEPEQIADFVKGTASGRVVNLRPLANAALNFECRLVSAGEISFHYWVGSLSAIFEFDPVAYARLVFQTGQVSRVTLEGSDIVSAPDRAGYILPEEVPATVSHPQGFRKLTVRIDPAALRCRLAMLTGGEIVGRIRFQQPTVADRRVSRYLRHAIFEAARELDGIAPRLRAPLLRDFQALVMIRMLLYLPHSHSHLLRTPVATPGRDEMRKLEEHLRQNWDKPLDLESLAAVSGVSGRTVLRYFRQAHDMTPREYLRDLRLEKARQELLEADGEKSVMMIALGCGFSSLGHFADAYRRRYGELPSMTLGRRRARS